MQSFGNARLAGIKPSAIRSMHERKRNSSIDLGMGQPTLTPDPEPFAVALDWVRRNGCPYAPSAGLLELREAIARIYGGYYGANAANVCVTNGSQEGIFLAIKALVDPHADEVLLTNPAYPSYERACQLEGVAYHHVKLSPHDGFGIHADAMLEALTPATRLIIFGSPANPTGSVTDERELHRLARLLLERKGPPIWVVVDEVYRELTFTGRPYQSLLDHYPHAIALQSLSKCCALTGLRLGFFIGPAEAVEAVTRAHALMLMSVNMFAQQVALAIVNDPQRLRAHHQWYAEQRNVLIESAGGNGLRIIEPQGAFYTLLALPQAWANSEAAADHLLERYDVVTVPGIVFGAGAEGYLRLTWAAQRASLVEGLARLAEFCKQATS
jgi:aspartate/methionine/tyrosine aminotransferase